MSRRIRVLFYRTAYGSLGGGDEMLLRLLGGIDRDAFAPRVLSSGWDEPCRRAVRSEDVPVDVVPYRGALDQYDEGLLSASFLEGLAAAARLVQFDVEARAPLRWADVVWTDCLRSLLTIAPWALASPTPTIWNVGLGRTGDGVDRWLNALGLAVADRVFIESVEQARRTFTTAQLARHGDQFAVFHKGVDVDRFRPSKRAVTGDGAGRDPGDEDGADPGGRNHDVDWGGSDCYRIGTAARITPRKGLMDLLEAVATVATEHEVHLLVAGEAVDASDRAYERRLRARVTELGMEESVTFLGWVEDTPAFYAGLDLFVLPSHDEGIPGSVREALAAGLPVVATDVGGTADVVRDGETGLLVDPGDPGALADAIRHCIEHTEAAQELGEAGRELVVAEFSASAYVERYESFLREVVAE